MTIKDIARISGVSITTVSRVLNHRPDVSDESRRRVLHNMCSSLLYNLSVILFGLLLPRLYLTSFG